MAQEITRYQSIIIESAKLFRTRGYLGTSIRDIGDALGITSAALYYHFKNKDELLLEIMLQSLRFLGDAVNSAIATTDDPLERLRVAMRAHLDISLQHQDFAIVLLQERRHLSPEAKATVVTARDAYELIWAELFMAPQRAQLFHENVDLRLLRLLTFGAMNLVVTWYKPEGTYTPDGIADAIFEYSGRGVLSPKLLETLNSAE